MVGYPVTVLVCALLVGGLVALGRWLKPRGLEPRLRYVVGGLTIAVWVVMNGWYLSPGQYDPGESWPLHICDLAAIIGPIGVMWRVRWMRGVLYFWGLALTTQGFITPVLNFGPGHMIYWLFWANHTIVVGLAVYDMIVGGYRPGPRDLGRTIGITAIWLVAVFTINYYTGWNYGYVGRGDPGAETIVQALGEWPLRVVWMALLALLAFVIVYVPWPIARKLKGRPRS